MLTQPLLISENKNILVLFLLRKYFAWYFQKLFCQLITKIILPNIVHNCSYSWRNRFLAQLLIWQDLKTFWISVWKNKKFIFLDLIDRISNNVVNNEMSWNKILSSLYIFNHCHICIFIKIRIQRKKWSEEINSIFINLNLL